MTLNITKKDWKYLAPKIPYQSKVYKSELPTIKYSKRSKTIKEHTGKVVSICVKLLTGEILSIAKGIHADILNKYHLDSCYVKESGWKLDNGNYLWR